jgi:hypothetical protein
MASATDTRRSRWGSEIPVTTIQDFIRTGLRHEAVADFVAEYVFDALASDASDGQVSAELSEALRLAFAEIIEASTDADWQRVGDDLVADARENLEAERDAARAALPVNRRRRATRHYYQPDGPKARSRRDTADVFWTPSNRCARKAPAGASRFASSPREQTLRRRPSSRSSGGRPACTGLRTPTPRRDSRRCGLTSGAPNRGRQVSRSEPLPRNTSASRSITCRRPDDASRN